METIDLADGGLMRDDESYLPSDIADRYVAELRDTSAWE